MGILTKACRWRSAVLGGVLAGLAVSCGGPTVAPDTGKPKLVIIGFDGMDPDLVREYIAAGQLPNIARVMQTGGLYDLDTTVSPESPTAWASFATGVNPGKHNIYDFLVRDLETYFPDLGMVTRTPPTFLWNWIPTSRPEVKTLRGGTSFWVTAGQAGVRSSIMTVPMTFPPEEVPNGELLSGLPLPDIRGTMGTFSYYASDLSRFEEGSGGTEMGGILRRLAFDGDTARTQLVGPPNPIVRAQLAELDAKDRLTDADRTTKAELETQADVTLPMTVTWTRGRGAADIDIDGQRVTLNAGEWSQWITVTFRVNLFVRVHGMLQVHLMKADDDVQVYVSPINWKPDASPVPISHPEGLAEDLYDTLGPYRTLGWAEATWPLNDGRMSEATFMDDLYRAFDDRAQVILSRLTAGSWDLFIGVIESTDRVQHMMWHHRDPEHPMHDAAEAAARGDDIARIYRRADQFIAEVIDQVGDETPIMIVSDHGFHSWRKAVNMNSWLVREGFMVLKAQAQSQDKTLHDLFGGGEFFEHVDWSQTRAYAMGLGQIYFNLRGRESQGIVSTGDEYRVLSDDLAARLTANFRDPDTGEQIVTNVYKRDDVYSGEFLHNASDLQVGFADGYRVSWQTTLGGAPVDLVYPNMRRWSGDHGGYDYTTTAGVLITNRPITTDTTGRANITDVAPTVLQFYGIPVPGTIDGRPFWR
jgi:predicted AlkP superfamily phosphohydrolase/phosphomutase